MSIQWLLEKISEELILKLGKQIIEAKNFYILCHIRPDPDMIGSALSMYFILKMLGKNVEIYNIETDNKSLYFLPGIENVKELDEGVPKNFKDNSQVIFFDTGDPYWTYYPSWRNLFQEKQITTWNIDHHSDNQKYADINIVHEECPACSMLLTWIYEKWNIVWTPEIATNLLAGILADTGNLMHDNTTSETFKTVSFLIKKDGDLNICIKKLFNTTTVERMRLWGLILTRIKWTNSDAVYSYATIKDLVDTNTQDEDLSGDILNMLLAGVKNSKYAIFIKEKTTETIKVSLRTTRNDIDVQEIAKRFGGGGHSKAAGFTLNNTSIKTSIPLLRDKL